MTRRLILLDLSSAQYFAMQEAIKHAVETHQWAGDGKTRAAAKRGLAKLEDAWEAKGNEGRGLDTRTPRRER